MTQYEYLVAQCREQGAFAGPGNTMVSLNELGAQGWRLVQMSGTVAYFERPLVEKGQIEYKAPTRRPAPTDTPWQTMKPAGTMTPAQERMAHAREAKARGKK